MDKQTFSWIALFLSWIHPVYPSEPLTAISKDAVKRQIESLREERSSACIDLGLSCKALQAIAQLNIDKSEAYDQFGDIHLLQKQIPLFIKRIGLNNDETASTLSKVTYQIATQIIEASGKKTAWISIRANTPSSEFDIPRWHIDGYYYSPFNSFAFKFVTVLKGKPTLLYSMEQSEREAFNNHMNDREFLHHFLSKERVQSPKAGHGVFFVVGDMRRAQVHSEPKIESERLFISVLPGDIAEIAELKDRWSR